MNSPSFEFYINLAKQYGFSVNKRNPGVLISDLASPATEEYRNNYNLRTIDLIFLRQFNRTLHSDLDELVFMLQEGFNSFVNSNRIKTKFELCNDSLKTKVTRRNNIDNISNSSIEYNNIINLYIIIRNIEEGKPYSQTKIKDIQKAAQRMKKISEKTMLEYIDDQFAANYNKKDGSLTYYKKKLEEILDKKK